MNEIKEMIQAAKNENVALFGEKFEQAIKQRVAEKLEEQKKEISKKYFSAK